MASNELGAAIDGISLELIDKANNSNKIVGESVNTCRIYQSSDYGKYQVIVFILICNKNGAP
jgi:hypothetical protein